MKIQRRLQKLETAAKSGEAPHGMVLCEDMAFWPDKKTFERHKRLSSCYAKALVIMGVVRGFPVADASLRLRPLVSRMRALRKHRIETPEFLEKEARFRQLAGLQQEAPA